MSENADIVALKKVDYSAIEKLVIETAWVQNKLFSYQKNFQIWRIRMERWFDIEIKFRNTGKAELKFTGIFTTETIQQALKAMQVVHAFNLSKKIISFILTDPNKNKIYDNRPFSIILSKYPEGFSQTRHI